MTQQILRTGSGSFWNYFCVYINLFTRKTKYLGFDVSSEGITMRSSYVEFVFFGLNLIPAILWSSKTALNSFKCVSRSSVKIRISSIYAEGRVVKDSQEDVKGK